ncbi:response regulator transcription factor [Priestia megaterium]|uniref:response regulator transcription factor n=1 Tax=Priestia megaterium TaxID=1404 RepID=UPI000BEC3618|nr:response regulator transcription factor [Priestia megaterium]PED63432.1 DNA-binding response regulator [Priestia megaterium]PFI61829.1 DNA-binding response regulator [Priestia megaterium]PGX23271.1 DNA-binding response regulator [Priestia megaterium]PGX40264.1 DNA-binding response regulator [Priestia megaterium]PGX73971.1 DNA-binding response regulator [Priestia megaterium]
MSERTILIVDDEVEIRNLMSIYLKNEGYQVVDAPNAVTAMDILKKQKIDLIILDVMMPGMNGIDACLKIREEHNMPIIFLSAKTEDMDKIHGLASGAEDYVTKPFNPLELMARVKSQLRRYYMAPEKDNSSPFLEKGDLKVDKKRNEVFVRDREVRLTPKEFQILSLLLRHQGQVFSIQQIYEAVWKEPFYKSDNTIMVHMTKIRDKIEENPKRPIYIQTVWGVGYKA